MVRWALPVEEELMVKLESREQWEKRAHLEKRELPEHQGYLEKEAEVDKMERQGFWVIQAKQETQENRVHVDWLDFVDYRG